MKREATPEQKAKAAERKATMRALAANIAKMNDAQRAELAARCPVVTIEGRALSPFNQCMIAHQRPSATVVGGFRQWLKAGRSVRKGEHGAGIWVPISTRPDGSETQAPENPDAITTEAGARCNFTVGTVFDVSQTEEKQPEEKGAR